MARSYKRDKRDDNFRRVQPYRRSKIRLQDIQLA